MEIHCGGSLLGFGKVIFPRSVECRKFIVCRKISEGAVFFCVIRWCRIAIQKSYASTLFGQDITEGVIILPNVSINKFVGFFRT